MASLLDARPRRRGKMSGMDETRLSLIDRIRDPRDTEAWARFVNFYEAMLMAYVRSLKVPAHDADVVVQNVIVKVWKAMPTFQLDHTRGRFRTWLYRITMNAVRDHFRRMPAGGSGMSEDFPEPAAVEPEPDEGWDVAVKKRQMEVALREVQADAEAKTWTCFEEHKLKGRDSNVVAEELGLTPEAVRKNASRVFKKVSERAREIAAEIDP